MKIYTFNAPQNTQVEFLWSLRSKNRDKMFEKFITQTHFTEVNSIEICDLAIYPQKAFDPKTLAFNDSIYKAAKLATKHNKPLVIDATSDSDVFLNIPDANILRCGLYKSTKKDFETECPFWSNYRTKNKLDLLDIVSKNKKPAVSFCGTTSSIGKLSTISKTLLPKTISKSVLSIGKYTAKIDIRLAEGMSLKLRQMALDILKSDRRIDTYFDITNPRQSYYLEDDLNKLYLENLFVNNISKCDYALCVRGTGNYSGRFYMALNAGRIPVLVDTDVVLPYENKLHIIKVPVQAIERIGEFILEHFQQTTVSELREMKSHNRWVYHQFLAPEN